jgi:hypothetical protein
VPWKKCTGLGNPCYKTQASNKYLEETCRAYSLLARRNRLQGNGSTSEDICRSYIMNATNRLQPGSSAKQIGRLKIVE